MRLEGLLLVRRAAEALLADEVAWLFVVRRALSRNAAACPVGVVQVLHELVALMAQVLGQVGVWRSAQQFFDYYARLLSFHGL